MTLGQTLKHIEQNLEPKAWTESRGRSSRLVRPQKKKASRRLGVAGGSGPHGAVGIPASTDRRAAGQTGGRAAGQTGRRVCMFPWRTRYVVLGM